MPPAQESKEVGDGRRGSGDKRVPLQKKFAAPTKKLTIAEEVGKKLKRLENKPMKDFLDICLREFDMAVSIQVSEMRDAFDDALNELRDNATSVEENITKLLTWKQKTCQERVNQALGERDRERKEKLALARWMQEFTPSELANTRTDEVDFAFIR